ncbi:MAG TPA: hypothetical protein VK629_09330 [Steroidobacteraceae bacterium]|nr:hypothetical protein [Steroidobacteraceae bacterium]
MFPRLLVIVLLSAVAKLAVASCFDTQHPDGESKETIALSQAGTDARFYYHSFDYGYILFVESADIISQLSQSKDGFDVDLLKLIAKDLPLTRHTDLLKYVLIDHVNAGSIQYALTDLLEQRKVGVYQIGTGSLEKSIELKRANFKSGRARTFYAKGNLIMFFMDCVED